MFREVAGQKYQQVAINDLSTVSSQLLKVAGDIRIWLFTGEMGAGKTTLIKVLCQTLGVDDNMSSPTFSIVNEYAARNEKIFHFDFFRIRSEAEAVEIGTEEYFYSGSYCFIEWPEKIPGLIPDTYVHVNLTLENETYRTIALSVHDGQEKNRI